MALDFAMPVGPVLLGVVTAIGGGLLRDVLAGNTNLLMKKEILKVLKDLLFCDHKGLHRST